MKNLRRTFWVVLLIIKWGWSHVTINSVQPNVQNKTQSTPANTIRRGATSAVCQQRRVWSCGVRMKSMKGLYLRPSSSGSCWRFVVNLCSASNWRWCSRHSWTFWPGDRADNRTTLHSPAPHCNDDDNLRLEISNLYQLHCHVTVCTSLPLSILHIYLLSVVSVATV